MALWSSQGMEPYDDTIFHCEFRVYSRNHAYLCVCGGGEKYSSLEEFCAYAKSLKPVYSPEEGVLSAEGFQLTCRTVQDPTQFVE